MTTIEKTASTDERHGAYEEPWSRPPVIKAGIRHITTDRDGYLLRFTSHSRVLVAPRVVR